MLLEEPYSELAPKIRSLSADCLGAGMPGHGWAPQHVDQALCGEMEQQQGETERGESRLVCTPVPLLVTVGPGRPGPDPTWVISAECEVGAGGWPCDHPSLPGVPSPQSPGS